MMRRFCCIYPHYYSIIHMYFFIQYIFFSLIEFAFAFFICELKRLFRPFHEFLFVPRLPLWPTILSNKHKPAQGLCAEFMVHHIVCNFQVGCTMYDFHNSTDTLKFWTEKWAINKTFLFFIRLWWNLVKLYNTLTHG